MSKDDGKLYLINRYKKEWWEFDDLKKGGRQAHTKNVKAQLEAIDYFNKKDRPLEILVINGSGRKPGLSPAVEISNSALLVKHAVKQFQNQKDINIETVNLREYAIETCNGCVSSASALCGFPCDCWPYDPMQELYPKVLKADVLLISTPVNTAAMSTKLKTFVDRLISLDGGFFIAPEQYAESKDEAWREKCLDVSLNQKIQYAQRLHGKVCAYFITSKDQNNPADKEYNYGELVSKSLYAGFKEYGCYHADDYWVIACGNPEEDYSYDKLRLNNDKNALSKAEKIAKGAVELAKQFKKNPPKINPGRANRT